jgi:hypothetical protein
MVTEVTHSSSARVSFGSGQVGGIAARDVQGHVTGGEENDCIQMGGGIIEELS